MPANGEKCNCQTSCTVANGFFPRSREWASNLLEACVDRAARTHRSLNKTRQSRALFNGTGASCPRPDRGSLQSFGGHVLIRPCHWIVFFGSHRPHVRLTIITCSWHRAGRCNGLSSVFADAHYERGSLYRTSRWTITSHGSERHLR